MIVDLILLVILIIAIFIGRKRGLTVCIISILSLLIAIVLALLLYKQVGSLVMEKTTIDENLKTIIQQNIPMSNTEIKISGETNLPDTMKAYINETTENINKTKDEQIEGISTELTQQIIYVGSFITIFIVARILLSLLKIIAKIINKLPVIKQIDHLGGAICGLIEGIIIIYIAFAVISIISPILKDTPVLQQIENSVVSKQMYNNNILVKKIYGK